MIPDKTYYCEDFAEVRKRFIKMTGDEKRKSIFNDYQRVIDIMKKSQNRSDELIARLELEQLKYL